MIAEESEEADHSLRLSRDQANRLILTARMHTTEELIEKLPDLISDQALLKSILAEFDGKTSSQRWNLKEKFARLTTLSKVYQTERPEEITEEVSLNIHIDIKHQK